MINITEYRFIELINNKYGVDMVEQFGKIEEEFNELRHAFAEYNQSKGKSIEQLKDGCSDLYSSVTYFSHLLGLYQPELLNMAVDKIKTREKDPNYKRIKPKQYTTEIEGD